MKAKDLIGKSGGTIEIFWENKNQEVEFIDAKWLNTAFQWVRAEVNNFDQGIFFVSFGPEDEINWSPEGSARKEVMFKSIRIEATQFTGKKSVKDIVEFVGGVGEFGYDLVYKERGPRGMFSGYELSINGVFWTGNLHEGEWLVKRNGKFVDLTDREFQILFGGDE